MGGSEFHTNGQAAAATAAKTLVVGLGSTGMSCVRHLSSRGLAVAVTDTRGSPPGLDALRAEYPDIAVFLGGFDAGVFAAAQQVIVSPGVSLDEPLIQQARQRGTEVLGDIELFAREVTRPVVAITGSNGKSTVTTLLGEMVRVAGRNVGVGGNLGRPVLDLLNEDFDLYVLELSSFQLETTRSLHPAVAVVLNLSPDHLDRHGDLDSYVRAKAGVYKDASTCVCNRDDPRAAGLIPPGCRTIGYSLQSPDPDDFGIAGDPDTPWLSFGGQRLLPVSALQLPGRHNQSNALAALALGTVIGLPMAAMLDALQNFRGLPHRTQFVRERRGVRWFNDSKATNLGACQAALEGLAAGDGSRTVLIAGGEGKGQDFRELTPLLRRHARSVILLGRDAPVIASAIGDAVPVTEAGGMAEAVQLAAEMAEPGDRTLLAPACASFDMFENYQARGDAFMAAVMELEP